MAKGKTKNNKMQEETDLSPGFFSSYGYGDGCFVITDPQGRKFTVKNGKRVRLNEK